MNKESNLDFIPNDLILEIVTRLPAKSIARFRCVSKLWESILHRQDFTELFHTMSSSNPRILIGIQKCDEWSFFLSPQPQSYYWKSSLVVAADFHMKLSQYKYLYHCSYTSGLIYFPHVINLNYSGHVERVIYNPSTGQHAILPSNTTFIRNFGGFFGFDPIGKQYKVLVFNRRVDDELIYNILTLGTENAKWREIICPFTYYESSEMISINGVLYYIAFDFHENYAKIGCFDVRSEKFKFLHVQPDVIPPFCKLVNYKGKITRISLKCASDAEFDFEEIDG